MEAACIEGSFSVKCSILFNYAVRRAWCVARREAPKSETIVKSNLSCLNALFFCPATCGKTLMIQWRAIEAHRDTEKMSHQTPGTAFVVFRCGTHVKYGAWSCFTRACVRPIRFQWLQQTMCTGAHLRFLMTWTQLKLLPSELQSVRLSSEQEEEKHHLCAASWFGMGKEIEKYQVQGNNPPKNTNYYIVFCPCQMGDGEEEWFVFKITHYLYFF